MVWEFGPITRRMYDPKRRWPRLITFFQGKDDENFITKTAYISRYTVLATGFFSMWDIVLMPHQGGIPTALARIKWWSVPFIGGGVTYCAAVNMLAGLRGKTDLHNHFWAGMAVGSVLGKHSRNIQTGIVTGVLVGLTGVVCKHAAMKGYNLFPDIPNKRQGNAMHYKLDNTLKADREGYWCRSEEDVPRLLARGQV